MVFPENMITHLQKGDKSHFNNSSFFMLLRVTFCTLSTGNNEIAITALVLWWNYFKKIIIRKKGISPYSLRR